MADSNSDPGDDLQSSIRGSSSTSDDISVPPFFNTTFSTHRVSPLYVGWRELDQTRLDELAHRLRDTLVGDVVRGIQITLESANTPAGQVGALRYVRMSWFDVDELLGDQDNSDGGVIGADPAVSFDGQNRGLWIEIRHENAAYVALILPGYSTNPEIIKRPDPSFAMQAGAVPLDPQLEEQRFIHLPLLLLRMPMALKGVIAEWLSSTFDCRVSKLSLGTRTLVNVWEGWIETYGVSSRGPDFTVTFSFNAPLPPKAGSSKSGSDSDSEMGLDMTGQTSEAGLRSMSIAVSPQDLRRFIRAGERLGAEKITTNALWETNARERHRIAGGNLDDGWAWRKTDSGDHPFTEALGRYMHHHFGLNMFHPAVRIIQISCGSFVLAQSRLKIVRYGEITEDFSRAAWMFATKLGDRIRGDELPTAISSGQGHGQGQEATWGHGALTRALTLDEAGMAPASPPPLNNDISREPSAAHPIKMQIVLAGATGKAGGQALKQCLKDDRITKVFVLSRRELTDAAFTDAKIEVILHQDFSQYPESLLERLSGVDACIWAIGGRVPQFDGDVEKCRRANVDFPVAAAKAMSASLASKTPGGKFRFVFCSGQMAEWDQDKRLYFMSDSRKIKGLAEKSLSGLADESPETLEVYYLEPSGFVDDKAGTVTKMVAPLYGGISEAQVGKALVKVALDGYKTRLVTNAEMQKL